MDCNSSNDGRGPRRPAVLPYSRNREGEMKRLLSITLCAAAVLLGWALIGSTETPAQQPRIQPPKLSVDALMRAKLHSSQSLLKGLALEDYALLKKESQRLETLSLDTGWNIIQTKDYVKISGEFREAAKQIRSAAQKKNIDGASLGYIRLTLSCVDCHRHMRTVRQ